MSRRKKNGLKEDQLLPVSLLCMSQVTHVTKIMYRNTNPVRTATYQGKHFQYKLTSYRITSLYNASSTKTGHVDTTA